MCGICGVVQLGGEPRDVIDSAALLRMTDVMTHRGPDDRGVYEAPGVALGMRRLAIVDVEGGQQPVTNERSDVWGDPELGGILRSTAAPGARRQRGHRLHTRCDTGARSRICTRTSMLASRCSCGACLGSRCGTRVAGER